MKNFNGYSIHNIDRITLKITRNIYLQFVQFYGVEILRRMTIELPPIFIELFEPDSSLILKTSGALLNNDMIREISRADYGMDEEAHYAALHCIWTDHWIPTTFGWEPHEVLSLTQWWEPSGEDAEELAHHHALRAFSCAALICARANAAVKYDLIGDNQKLIQFIDSAFYLGGDLTDALGSFLTWQLPLLDPKDEETPFYAFGLAAIALITKLEKLNETTIEAIIDFVERSEMHVLDPANVCTIDMFPETSFLSANCFNIKHDKWRALARKLHAHVPNNPKLTSLVERIVASKDK